jgi:hypothetical protein
MSNTPFLTGETMRLYRRVSKLKPSSMLDHEPVDPQDTVNMATEAKKRQILEQARTEVLNRIRDGR